MIDSRTLEDRAERLNSQAKAIHAMRDSEGQVPESKRDELMRMIGEIHAIEHLATETKDIELAELRAIVRNGTSLTGGYRDAGSRAFLDYIHTGEVRTPRSRPAIERRLHRPRALHAEMAEKVRKVDPIFAARDHIDMSGG